MCGMIGSAQGWHEVPYITAEQADVSGLSQGCFRFSHQDRHISIIPGLSLAGFDGTIDVMRGEETLYLGATAGLPEQDRYICLPGTHSKWPDARAGRIDSFATFMTGEMFELATSHSMLAPVLEALLLSWIWTVSGKAGRCRKANGSVEPAIFSAGRDCDRQT